jgi:hypothetical protein
MKSIILGLCLILGSSFASASDTYVCDPDSAHRGDSTLLAPGESRVIDYNSSCASVLVPENLIQLIIGFTTPSGGYIATTGKDMLGKMGLEMSFIDSATGIDLFALAANSGTRVCSYAAGQSFEFYNSDQISSVILRPVQLRIKNVGRKSYYVHTTVAWSHQLPDYILNCSRYGGKFL